MSIDAIAPRTKISWAAGSVWLTYLTSPSLTMKHAIAPIIDRTPMRLALAIESWSPGSAAGGLIGSEPRRPVGWRPGAFLASPAGDYLTGTVLFVDGRKHVAHRAPGDV